MTAVLVHGVPEVAAVWRPLVTALAARGVTDVVLLSPPGFGAPVPSGFDATPVGYRDWLVAELESIDGPIDLVGHDWGAAHSLAVAADRPDLLRSCAADCAGLVHPEYVWHDMAQAWQTPEVGEQVIEMMVGQTTAEKTATVEGLGLPSDVAADMAVGMDAEMGRCILTLYRAAVPPFGAGLGDRLAAADRRPLMCIVPTEDPYVAASLCTAVAERLAAPTGVLTGAGHWWMAEQPDQAADALVSFWSSL